MFMSESEYLETTDTNLAAFLVAKQIPLRASTHDGNRTTFRFKHDARAETLINAFYTPGCEVCIKDFTDALRMLRGLVAQNKRAGEATRPDKLTNTTSPVPSNAAPLKANVSELVRSRDNSTGGGQ